MYHSLSNAQFLSFLLHTKLWYVIYFYFERKNGSKLNPRINPMNIEFIHKGTLGNVQKEEIGLAVDSFLEPTLAVMYDNFIFI